MKNKFYISDTHFGHKSVWEKFKLNDGVTPLRDFQSTEEMDEHMIAQWDPPHLQKNDLPEGVVYETS